MEEDRVVRIARALCRSARLDPDQPIDAAKIDMPKADSERAAGEAPRTPVAAWTMFRRAAEEFVLRHGEQLVAPL